MKHPIETVLRNIATYDDWIDTDLRKHVMVAADEIDSLRSELAKAREEIKRLRDTLSFAKARLGVEVSTLKAELARARAALGPFAKAAHCYEYTPPIYDDRDLADNDHVTVGDLRRARLALQPEETP